MKLETPVVFMYIYNELFRAGEKQFPAKEDFAIHESEVKNWRSNFTLFKVVDSGFCLSKFWNIRLGIGEF